MMLTSLLSDTFPRRLGSIEKSETPSLSLSAREGWRGQPRRTRLLEPQGYGLEKAVVARGQIQTSDGIDHGAARGRSPGRGAVSEEVPAAW